MTKGGLYGRVFDATAGGQSAETLEVILEDNKLIVPFAAFEVAILRLERANRRLIVVIALLIALLFGTNAAWLWYESQFSDEVITVEQDTKSGYNNYIGNDGDITNNGTPESDN